MTGNSGEERTEAEESGRKGWMDEAQEALDRASDALRAAWDATRDTRLSALESAKTAVDELGEVVERGVTVAKERWGASAPTADEVTDEAPSWGPAEDTPEDQ